MKVIVTGGRDYGHLPVGSPPERVRQYEKEKAHIIETLTPFADSGTPIVVGDCASGVDFIVREYFDTDRVFKADWKTHGRRAGPLRNEEMVEDTARGNYCILIAFPGGKGTADCVKQAVKYGVPVLMAVTK